MKLSADLINQPQAVRQSATAHTYDTNTPEGTGESEAAFI